MSFSLFDSLGKVNRCKCIAVTGKFKVKDTFLYLVMAVLVPVSVAVAQLCSTLFGLPLLLLCPLLLLDPGFLLLLDGLLFPPFFLFLVLFF